MDAADGGPADHPPAGASRRRRRRRQRPGPTILADHGDRAPTGGRTSALLPRRSAAAPASSSLAFAANRHRSLLLALALPVLLLLARVPSIGSPRGGGTVWAAVAADAAAGTAAAEQGGDGALGAAFKERQTHGGAAAAAAAAANKKKVGSRKDGGGGGGDEPTAATRPGAVADDGVKHGPPPLAGGGKADGRGGGGGAGGQPTQSKSTEEEESAEELTQHGREKLESYVDMTNMDLGSKDPAEAARLAVAKMSRSLEDRMANMFEKARTEECRTLIGEHFGYFVNAIGVEGGIPFHEEQFYSECTEEKYDFDFLPEGMSLGDVQNRTYQPPRNETEYLDDPADLRLLYAILTHYDPNATIRLIEALHEDGHTFVVHVDGKESADETYRVLVEYASTRHHVHVLPDPLRIRANWGGFTLVNATMQILRYAFAMDGYQNDEPLDFHKFVHIASTSYPIASNTEIRRRIASYPIDANFMNVVFKPANPSPAAWHYFVECDDALHRIYRLTPLDDLNWGIDIYTSSQWFIISREFALYLAEARPGTLAHDLLEYAEHVVVADESFFGTTLRHSKFCGKHHNDNFLHVQFDRWENEIDEGERDERKCVMPDPNHCGRSPTTMTLDYLPILEMSGDLFARKFLDEVDPRIKDVIDLKRARDEEALRSSAADGSSGDDATILSRSHVDTSFEGHGVLIAAKETLYDDVPLCLGLGQTRNRVRLFPCFRDGVPQTLAPGWETGAVIEEETLLHNRWDLGPCSSDGNLERTEHGEFNVTPGSYSKVGPSCLLKQRDGLRAGRCVDVESERLKPGGKVHVFPCVKRWSQFVAFGDGSLTPKGSIHANIPLHIIKRIESKGRTQEQYLCFGVAGRGKPDTDEWEEDAALALETKDANETESVFPDTNETDANGTLPLKLWSGKQLVTTPCSNVDAVIEWRFIPYIVEDEDEDAVAVDQASASEAEEDEEL